MVWIPRDGKNIHHAPSNRMMAAAIAGERSVNTGTSLVKEINTNPNFNSWQTDSLVFYNTPLRQLVVNISKHYDASVTIRPEDSAVIAETVFTGRFHKESLSAVLKEIAMAGDLKVTAISEKRYEFSKN